MEPTPPPAERDGRAAGAQVTSPGSSEPDLWRLRDALSREGRARSIVPACLLFLAACYALHSTRELFLPIVLSMLLNFLLSPVIRKLRTFRVPEAAGAVLVMALLLGAVGLGIQGLAGPVREWADEAPATLAKVERKLRAFRRPMEQVTRTAEQVEKATTVPAAEKSTEVVVRGPRLSEQLFGTTGSIALGVIQVIVLLFFLLSAGDFFLQRLISVLPRPADKARAMALASAVEASVSTYLGTMTLINIGQGIVVGLALWALGMPHPASWGALVVLFQFVPYVGPAVLMTILGVGALSEFDSVGHALLMPGVYALVTFLQSNFISPLLLGRRLTLNPVAIVIGIMFWWWMWGVPGAFIAVPVVATLKLFCDEVEPLRPIGAFLGK